MKVYELRTGSTSLGDLRQAERPEPTCGVHQVLVRVRAASLNYRDQAILTGRYFGGAVPRDTIPLSDGAGEVVAVGIGVSRFKPGDRVVGTFFQGWINGPQLPSYGALGSPLDGVLAEYVVLDQEGLSAIPRSLSFEEAACLPCAGVTAWHALMTNHRIKPGDTVLALGTGGVSMFALQLGRLAGARVIMTSSSDEKIARAIELGATAGVNYRETPDWEREVMRLTEGRGVDHVIEVGGAGTLGRSVQTLAYSGEVSLIGVLAPPGGDPNLGFLMLRAASIRGIFVGNRQMLEDLIAAISTNDLKPIIDTVFPFEAAADAYAYQLSGKHMGKIVITI